MKRTLAILPVLALSTACADRASPLGAGAAAVESAAAGTDVRWFVVLGPGADPRSVAAVMGIHPRLVYTAAVNGFAADLNAVMNCIQSTATLGVTTLHSLGAAYHTPNRLLYTGL